MKLLNTLTPSREPRHRQNANEQRAEESAKNITSEKMNHIIPCGTNGRPAGVDAVLFSSITVANQPKNM